MGSRTPNQTSLLRCAEAAGYGAVSWCDEEPVRTPARGAVFRFALLLLRALF